MTAGWQHSAERFEQSYGEVLAFVKHTDDKIGRLLTALAFLTASGITLFAVTRSGHPPPGLQFGHSDWRAGSIFFLLFLGGVVGALTAAFVALDPTSHTPN